MQNLFLIIEQSKDAIAKVSGISVNYVEQRGIEILDILRTISPNDRFGRLGNKSNSYYQLFNVIERMCQTGEIVLDYDFKVFNQSDTISMVGDFKTIKDFNKYFSITTN